MKKIILAGLLLAVGSVAMANSAQDVLKKARDDYYKQQEAERKAMEKLEYNANKAAIKVDYYERVVRSVAREEKELDGYNEVLGKKKSKKVKEQKAEKTKKAKK